MNIRSFLPWLAAALAGAGPSALAVEAVFGFDEIATGGPANAASRAGVTFEPAYYGQATGPDGLAIPGSDAWRIDGSAPEVTADNPMLFGRGPAPTPVNALNALFQPVLVQFASPQLIRQFSVTLDADAFGERGLTVNFYDGADRLLAALPIDQTQPGFSLNEASLNLAGVDSILLPAGAFYDTLAVSSIPEPGAALMLALGAGCVGWRLRRRG